MAASLSHALKSCARVAVAASAALLFATGQASAQSLIRDAEIENTLRQQKLEAELADLRAAAKIERTAEAVPPAAIRQSDLVRN